MSNIFECQYYDEELDLKGTAAELYVQARNGYFDDNVKALKRILEIQNGEKLLDNARMVQFMINRAEEGDVPFSMAQAKMDFLNGYDTIDDVNLSDDYVLSMRMDTTDSVIVSVYKNSDDCSAADEIDFNEFLMMSQAEIERRVNSLIFYS